MPLTIYIPGILVAVTSTYECMIRSCFWYDTLHSVFRLFLSLLAFQVLHNTSAVFFLALIIYLPAVCDSNSSVVPTAAASVVGVVLVVVVAVVVVGVIYSSS